ncbi:histone deacetylase family protein [Leptolyngbya ohadii]|uniref:histone deacetylase family protein n=1 Tax=Leptolyngbya ohadii TaxID=1962290 RepID=UPI000B59EA94|nr:histone deacetylase [Leptolyngbya ohadii]
MISILYSDEFLDHDTGSFHVENAGRLKAIVSALQQAPWHNQLDWLTPTSIDWLPDRLMKALHAIHPPQYVEAVKRLAHSGGGRLDMDTVVSLHSYEVALLAVNAWLDGVDRVLSTGNPAFVIARPPGHHALATRGMGFCLFANAAIAAHYALTQPGIDRVGILDWDVHHGNGTQAIVETNPQIAFCSLHESPQYPGTGQADERGQYNNVLNFPMQAGSSLADYEPIFKEQIVPFFQAFQPDLLIISAGYDANQADPLAHLSLQPSDYGIFTRYCQQICDRLLFGLEGGYDYGALSQSVVETIGQLV